MEIDGILLDEKSLRLVFWSVCFVCFAVVGDYEDAEGGGGGGRVSIETSRGPPGGSGEGV